MPHNVALIDPRKAAARTLATYLGTISTIDTGRLAGPYPFAKSYDDWPELDKPLVYPSVSCVPIPGDYEATDLGLVYLYDDPIYKQPNWPTAYGLAVPTNATQGYLLAKAGEYHFPLQLDLWADTIPQLDACQRAVEDAMNGATVPSSPGLASPNAAYFGLRLNAGTSYFNRTCEYGLRRDVSNTVADQALRDERRRTLIVDTSIEWIRATLTAGLQPTIQYNISEQPLPTPPKPGTINVEFSPNSTGGAS